MLVGLKRTQHCLQMAAASKSPVSLWLSQVVMFVCGTAGALLLQCCPSDCSYEGKADRPIQEHAKLVQASGACC